MRRGLPRRLAVAGWRLEPLRLPACRHDGRLGAGLVAEGGQTDAYAGLGCECMGNHRFALMLAEALPLAVR